MSDTLHWCRLPSAMVKCPACQRLIAFDQTTCPHCGFVIPAEVMGRLIRNEKRKNRRSMAAGVVFFVALFGLAWLLG